MSPEKRMPSSVLPQNILLGLPGQGREFVGSTRICGLIENLAFFICAGTPALLTNRGPRQTIAIGCAQNEQLFFATRRPDVIFFLDRSIRHSWTDLRGGANCSSPPSSCFLCGLFLFLTTVTPEPRSARRGAFFHFWADFRLVGLR